MPSYSADILVEVTRGAITESIHRGHIAVIDRSHKRIAYSGNPDYYTFARSTAKLLQAIPLLEAVWSNSGSRKKKPPSAAPPITENPSMPERL